VQWRAIENLLRARLRGVLGGLETKRRDSENFGHRIFDDGETVLLSSKAGVDCKGIPWQFAGLASDE
jgi:hypothetical protein